MADLKNEILEQATLLRDEVTALNAELRAGLKESIDAFDRMARSTAEISLALEVTGDNLTAAHENVMIAEATLTRIEQRLDIARS